MTGAARLFAAAVLAGTAMVLTGCRRESIAQPTDDSCLTGVVVAPQVVDLTPGDTAHLVTIMRAGCLLTRSQTAVWESRDSSVAAVHATGKTTAYVQGLTPGATAIIARSLDDPTIAAGVMVNVRTRAAPAAR